MNRIDTRAGLSSSMREQLEDTLTRVKERQRKRPLKNTLYTAQRPTVGQTSYMVLIKAGFTLEEATAYLQNVTT